MFHRTQHIDTPGCKVPDNLCFYIDNDDEPVVNNFLRRNYNSVQQEFKDKGLELIYLPMLDRNVDYSVLEYFSGADNPQLDSHSDRFMGILPDIVCKRVHGPAIVHHDRLRERFEVATFGGPAHDFPELYVHSLVYEYSQSMRVHFVSDEACYGTREDRGQNVRRASRSSRARREYLDIRRSYHIEPIEPEPTDYEDEKIYRENRNIIRQVSNLVEKLRQRGFDEDMLKKLLAPAQKLSRLRITKDYRFILVDYNKEVKMTPLQKSLLVLYLRYPEGIPFKLLIDYKDELYKIYHEIDGWNFVRQRKRIDNICDSTRNTINENATRIRTAFRAVIDDDLAHNYYITGKQGEPMSIQLDRSLVVWE